MKSWRLDFHFNSSILFHHTLDSMWKIKSNKIGTCISDCSISWFYDFSQSDFSQLHRFFNDFSIFPPGLDPNIYLTLLLTLTGDCHDIHGWNLIKNQCSCEKSWHPEFRQVSIDIRLKTVKIRQLTIEYGQVIFAFWQLTVEFGQMMIKLGQVMVGTLGKW